MEQPPSKIPRLAAAHHVVTSGAGTCFGTKNKQGLGIGAGEGSSRMGLGLNLDLGGGGGGYWLSKPSGFTLLQMQELEHQALIYTYIKAGLAVPYQLLLPIWKSVASSLMTSGLHGQQRSTSHYHWSSPLYSEYCRSSMEAEPGRCRRTDGKKWRCSRDVVTDHKYCDKHVNRGRSKKQLQPLPPKTTTPTVTSSHAK